MQNSLRAFFGFATFILRRFDKLLSAYCFFGEKNEQRQKNNKSSQPVASCFLFPTRKLWLILLRTNETPEKNPDHHPKEKKLFKVVFNRSLSFLYL